MWHRQKRPHSEKKYRVSFCAFFSLSISSASPPTAVVKMLHYCSDLIRRLVKMLQMRYNFIVQILLRERKMSMDDAKRKTSELALEVLLLSRNQLLVNLRFLDAALSRLEPQELPELTYATDGRTLAYDPRHVLKCYKQERAVPVRDYLHIVLHCIYRHMFVHTLVDHTAWDLACDIAAEYTITGLGLKATAAWREEKQQTVYQKLEKEKNEEITARLVREISEQIEHCLTRMAEVVEIPLG